MAQANKTPVTRAILTLREAGVEFDVHPYRYEERGGTRVSARELGVDEHAVIKTLVMQDQSADPLIVLMHGDFNVSTRHLARQLERKSINPCRPDLAQRITGYKVGGTSPFGTVRPLPIYAEYTIFELDRLYINGGSRGFLVSMVPAELERVLSPEWVEVAVPRKT